MVKDCQEGNDEKDGQETDQVPAGDVPFIDLALSSLIRGGIFFQFYGIEMIAFIANIINKKFR